MFSFQKTRMIKAAELGGRGPYTTGRLIGFFFLVFLAASIGQSMILTPAQLIAILTKDEFLSVLKNNSLPLSERLSALLSVDLSMPAWVMAVQLFSTAFLIVACILFCRIIEKRSLFSMGFVKEGAVTEYLVGIFAGFTMMTLAVLFCVVTGQASFLPFGGLSRVSWGMILLFLLGFLVQGLSEELLCRSFLMVSLARGHKPWFCVLINSLLFAALHLFNPGISPLALVNLILFGIFASVYTLRRGSIWGIAAIHSIWNFTQGNFYGVAVSGMGDNPSVLYWDTAGGSSFINGGSFGLEGGLAVTVVLLVSLAVILLIPTKASEISKETEE